MQLAIGLPLGYQAGAGGVAGLPYIWTAPSYRLDSSGRAYNVPTITGSELFTNPGFASDTAWTKGLGWSIGSGVASRSGTAAQSNLTQSPAIDRYRLYRLIYTLTALSAGSSLGIVQGTGTGPRRTALGTYSAWARLGQSTTYGFQAVANSELSIDNAALYEVDMDSALAMLNVTEEVDRVGVALESAPVDDAMMLVMAAGAANSLYNCILSTIFQNTNGEYRVRLFKVVDGIPSSTIGADGTITFVAGAKLEIRRSGTTYTVWYNGVATAATGTITDASIVSNQYHGFCVLGSSYRVSNFWLNGRRVPFSFPMVPLASDGFSIPGTTDGLGHTGAAGGSGLSWADAYGGLGGYATTGGKLIGGDTSALGGIDAPYTVAVGMVDVDVAVEMTHVAGDGGVVARMSDDASNYVRAAHDGTNALLIKVVSGSPTTVLSVPTAPVAAGAIRLRARGEQFQLYYAGEPVGDEQTISDAALQTGRNVGVSSSGDGNEFDNFVCYAS